MQTLDKQRVLHNNSVLKMENVFLCIFEKLYDIIVRMILFPVQKKYGYVMGILYMVISVSAYGSMEGKNKP